MVPASLNEQSEFNHGIGLRLCANLRNSIAFSSEVEHAGRIGRDDRLAEMEPAPDLKTSGPEMSQCVKDFPALIGAGPFCMVVHAAAAYFIL